MPFTEISLLVRLFLGALATFFAILLWSKAREGEWLLVILAVIIMYGEIIYSTLQKFGILLLEDLTLFGLPVSSLIQVVLINLPLILLAIAFMIAVIRRRLP